MKDNQSHLNTNAVDLFAPANRFVSATRLYGRLHRWWLLLRKFWWLPVLIFSAVAGPSYLLTTRSGPSYESKANMWVTGRINVSESWSYTEELVNFLGTQAALLESPAIQNEALARLRAESKPGTDPTGTGSGSGRNFFRGAETLWQKIFASSPVTDSNAPPAIPFTVKVLEGSKSSTLELRAIGREPGSTRRFLDCLMEVYLNFKRESRDQASTQAATSLDSEATELKSELAAAQDKLQAFQESNNVVLLQQQGSGAENYLASLNRQLASLRTEQKLLDSLKPEQWVQTDALQVNASQSPDEDATARQVLNSLTESQATLFQADQQMHVLMARRDELAQLLRPAHPKIIQLDQDIATQQELVQAAGDEASKQLTLRREALELQITNLEAAFKEWDAKAIEASRKMAEYEQLQQTTQRLQDAYDKTFALNQNLEVANRVEQENIGILDPASVAKPTDRLLINMAIAAAVSFMLCFGLFYFLSLFQDSFASHTELAEQFAEPVVGQIPSVTINSTTAPPGKPLGIAGLERQCFEFLEAFRNIRTSLLFMNNGRPNPQVVVVTSSMPGEGKSTAAFYLAATLSKGNSRVLLVDGDMRRPSLHKFFGLPCTPGLAEVLAGEIPATDAIRPSGTENLVLLPAGQARRNPGDLVLSPAWVQFLAMAKLQFDYILVDTPPVAATNDAAVLAPQADGVLFVVRALTTSARVARGALDVLRQRHARVLGLIFNGAVSSPYERQYYQPYAHAYHWEPDQTRAAELAGHLLSNPASKAKMANGHD